MHTADRGQLRPTIANTRPWPAHRGQIRIFFPRLGPPVKELVDLSHLRPSLARLGRPRPNRQGSTGQPWPTMARAASHGQFDETRPSTADYGEGGQPWPTMANHGQPWPTMARAANHGQFDETRPTTADYGEGGQTWPSGRNMANYGQPWQTLAWVAKHCKSGQP